MIKGFYLVSALGILLTLSASSASAYIRCESGDGRYHECHFDGFGDVELHHQISRSACVRDQSWGQRGHTIWVKDGCRADFVLVERHEEHHHERTLVCESHEGRREFCRADTMDGVFLNKELGRRPCVEGRSWGYNRDGIWVSDGCRAEFIIGRRDHHGH